MGSEGGETQLLFKSCENGVLGQHTFQLAAQIRNWGGGREEPHNPAAALEVLIHWLCPGKGIESKSSIEEHNSESNPVFMYHSNWYM